MRGKRLRGMDKGCVDVDLEDNIVVDKNDEDMHVVLPTEI